VGGGVTVGVTRDSFYPAAVAAVAIPDNAYGAPTSNYTTHANYYYYYYYYYKFNISFDSVRVASRRKIHWPRDLNASEEPKNKI